LAVSVISTSVETLLTMTSATHSSCIPLTHVTIRANTADHGLTVLYTPETISQSDPATLSYSHDTGTS
jgi:hypothetical protein